MESKVTVAYRTLYKCPECGYESVVGPGARDFAGFDPDVLDGLLIESCPDCLWRFLAKNVPQMKIVKRGLGLEENNEKLYEQNGVIPMSNSDNRN